MNRNLILDAVGELDSNLLEQHFKKKEALNMKRPSRSIKSICIRIGAVAACLCLAVAGVLIWRQSTSPTLNPSGIIVDENGVTIPKKNISLSDSGAQSADMIPFFIYNGNCYVEYEGLAGDSDIVGEKLGTATGLIHEWTPKDGYVELAGSVSGDFYAVKGYDPSFMLCMKRHGNILTYICNTGITLKYGSDLYEDRLFLSEQYTALSFETRESWYHSRGEQYEIADSRQAVITDFLTALNNAEFIPFEEVMAKEEFSQSEDYYKEIFHMYFHMANGTTVHLRLHEDGYVQYQGLLDVCVQIPADTFQALLDLFQTTSGLN